MLSGQRRQTLHALDITNMDLNGEKYTFLMSLLKTSRPGKHLASIEVQSYKTGNCAQLRTYKSMSNERRICGAISVDFSSVTRNPIMRFQEILLVIGSNTLHLAGVNTAKFSAHSTRAATRSTAKAMKMPIDIIMQSAGWTQESTFGKYYHKPV